MNALLSLRSLSRRFGGLTALDTLSLDVPAGARHAVIGPNGAGKTTLLNLVAGTLRPSSGSISYAGRDVTNLPGYRRARRGIGRSWQHPAVFTRLSVAANLTLAAAADRVDDRRARLRRGDVRTRIGDLVDLVNLTGYATVPAGHLPYGLQRRLELAMALATRPRLLLLDEPSAGLDPAEANSLVATINALGDDAAVLLIDHNLELVWRLADTVTVLDRGRHLVTASPAQVRADPLVQSAYLGVASEQPAKGRSTGRTPTRPLLAVRDLVAGHRGAPALTGITLDVGAGETVAVLGRNGAGKTTLLNTITGLLPEHSGDIEYAGQPLTGRPAHERTRAGIALVPQGRRLFAPLTVTEHLVCAAAPRRHGAGQPWTPQQILDLLPALAARAHHAARHLSGGEQQTLAIARALATRPRLLILDEPAEGLAPAITAQLANLLSELTARGLAVLVAEPNPTMAATLADRVAVLHSGRVALNVPANQLTEPVHRQHLHTLLGVAASAPNVDTEEHR